jgi:hypothetical protein
MIKKVFHPIRLFLVLPVFLASDQSNAADNAGLYQALNYVSCQQYEQDRKLPVHSGRNAADEIYLSGWLSAYNYLTPNTYDIVPNHDIMKVMEWLDGYCKANPTKGLEAGLLQFVNDFYTTRTKQYIATPTSK